jgi:hypothetical protein
MWHFTPRGKDAAKDAVPAGLAAMPGRDNALGL